METEHVVVIAASWLAIISGTLIPFITGLITKKVASPAVKAVCTAILSVIAGIVSAAQANNGAIHLEQSVTNIFVAFITAIGLYYGLYRPTTAAAKVQNIAPEVGVG